MITTHQVGLTLSEKFRKDYAFPVNRAALPGWTKVNKLLLEARCGFFDILEID